MRLSAPAGTAKWALTRSQGRSKDLLQGDTALKAEVGSAGSSLPGFGQEQG